MRKVVTINSSISNKLLYETIYIRLRIIVGILIRFAFFIYTIKHRNRTYKTEFAVIDELAKAYRHSEQRQALARSRYIFHPVTFYILAKEPIDLYEPYLPKPICYNYREEDLFRPRKQRIDNKYEEVKTFIIEALTTPIKGTNRYLESVSDNYIAKTYKLNRNTVRNHREQLESEKFIERVSPRKYRLVDSSN